MIPPTCALPTMPTTLLTLETPLYVPCPMPSSETPAGAFEGIANCHAWREFLLSNTNAGAAPFPIKNRGIINKRQMFHHKPKTFSWEDWCQVTVKHCTSSQIDHQCWKSLHFLHIQPFALFSSHRHPLSQALHSILCWNKTFSSYALQIWQRRGE